MNYMQYLLHRPPSLIPLTEERFREIERMIDEGQECIEEFKKSQKNQQQASAAPADQPTAAPEGSSSSRRTSPRKRGLAEPQ